jgi:hypothetical protein
LTPHGLRHSHKTWMIEDNIPEILAEQRLGHQVPGIRGLYAHASDRMRAGLTAALQARWEDSLRERSARHPRSPLPLLDELLAPIRAAEIPAPARPRALRHEPMTPDLTSRNREKMISQIPPNHPATPHHRRRNGGPRPHR